MIGVSFSFAKTTWNEDRTILSCEYVIKTDEESFQLSESLDFPIAIPQNVTTDKLTKALHLALGISYYKAFIPPELLHSYNMSDYEASFWNTVYRNGLGEFLYKNNLSADKLAQFTPQNGTEITSASATYEEKALLGIGGGKDSIVAGELLKELSIDVSGFVLATGEILGQTKDVADIMGINLQPVKRRLDQQIIEINKLDGAFNGHIPISLIFALTGCMLAAADQRKYVVVANEASASIPHVSWDGMDINHQWSKSLEFERLFQEYVVREIDEQLQYFSAIRPLTSLGIAKLFSRYPSYFNVFTSDNSVFRIKQGERDHPRWSHDSPKSLSSFILMSPYMTDEQLKETFGRNFLDEPELEELFISLLGRSNTPILDCVGTPNELLYSLQELHRQERFTNTALMQKASNEGLVGNDKSTVEAELLSQESAFPPKINTALTQKIQEKLL